MAPPFLSPLTDLRLVAPEALAMPASYDWLSYWDALSAQAPEGVARRADLDLIRDRPQLARLAVWIEVLADDYRFILAGEDVRWLFGRSIRGMWLSDIDFNGFGRLTRQQYDTAVADRRPCCSLAACRFSPDSTYRVGGTVTRREMSMLPFVNADGAVDRLLAGMAFDLPGRAASGP